MTGGSENAGPGARRRRVQPGRGRHYEDRSGPVLVEGLRAMGFRVDGPVVVPDGDPVGDALREAVAAGTTSCSPPAARG